MAEEALGYEQARDELHDIVQRLEAGGLTLEESLSLWERGEQLAAICQQWLDGARTRLAAAAGPPAAGPPAAGRPAEPAADESGRYEAPQESVESTDHSARN